MLQTDLVAVTGIQVAVEAPATSVIEAAKSISEFERPRPAHAIAEVSVPVVLEQIRILDDEKAEQGAVITEIKEKLVAETKRIDAEEVTKSLDQEAMKEIVKILTTEQQPTVESTKPTTIEQVEVLGEKGVPKDVAATVSDVLAEAVSIVTPPVSASIPAVDKRAIKGLAIQLFIQINCKYLFSVIIVLLLVIFT